MITSSRILNNFSFNTSAQDLMMNYRLQLPGPVFGKTVAVYSARQDSTMSCLESTSLVWAPLHSDPMPHHLYEMKATSKGSRLKQFVTS